MTQPLNRQAGLDSTAARTVDQPPELPALSVVVIGRNEGENLASCLKSIAQADYPAGRLELIYVDSNSTDDSCAIATAAGAEVLRITSGPLSAARARNVGWRAARYEHVHFVDGDTELDPAWFRKAVDKLAEPSIGCVFGLCTERRPTASIYMRVCNLDWHVQSGPRRYCGGIALFRRELLLQLGGFCEQMVAGEEPELCYRLRGLGWQVWLLNEPMVLHDLNMTRFGQYWRRATRSGWAYCVVAARCCRSRERLWLKENLVNFGEVTVWLGLITWALGARSWWGLAVVVGLLMARTFWISAKMRRRADSWGTALLYGLHCQFGRLPVALGQLRGLWYVLRHPASPTQSGLSRSHAESEATT